MHKNFIQLFFALLVFQTTLLSQTINIDTIVNKAYKEHKKVILYLHRTGCSYCNSMQEFTLEDESVEEYMNKHFVIIQINISHKDTITYKGKVSGGICLAKRIGYDFYPSTLFLDSKANIEYATVGYKNESEFLIILQYIKNSLQNSISLKEYEEKLGYTKDKSAEIDDPRKHRR